MKLSAGVHLIASGATGCSYTHPNDCNVYAVDCGGVYLLVDAGVGIQPEVLLRNLEEDGVRPMQIGGLLFTHAHLDHSGGTSWLHKHLRVPVTASIETAKAIESADEDAISLTAAKRAGVYPDDVHLFACEVENQLRGGEVWTVSDSRIEAIRTPGHSHDMLTYLVWRPEGLLAFSGDTVFAGGKILISDVYDCSPPDYANSLRCLAGYPIDGLFPGHSIWALKTAAVTSRTACRIWTRCCYLPIFSNSND